MSCTNIIPEAACKASNLNSRMKSGIIKKYKPFYAKLYQHSKGGVARLELFADEKSSVSGVPMFVIVAADVIKVSPCGPLSSDEEHAFQIHVKDQINLFSAKTAKERDDWVTMIQNVFFQTSAAAPAEQEVTSENDLYMSADEVTREFLVSVGAETRTKLGFDGMVRLLVEDGHITLIGKAGNRLTRWGVEHLRRFGYRANDFHLEAGRKSMSGEGTFTFVTAQGKQIHAMVTKEKHRTRTSFQSGQLPGKFPVGQVPAPEPSNEPTLTIGGHIYEEMPATATKIIPSKPPRQTGPTPKANFDMGALNTPPEVPRPMSFTNMKSPRTNGAPSEGEVMHRVPQGLPTMKAEVRPPVSTSAVYEEPELITNAWRTHGRDVDDQPIVESTYDNLQRYPQPNIVTESHYASSPITPWSKVDRKMLTDLRTQQRMHQQPKVEHIVVNQDAIYTVVQPRTQRTQEPAQEAAKEPNPDDAY